MRVIPSSSNDSSIPNVGSTMSLKTSRMNSISSSLGTCHDIWGEHLRNGIKTTTQGFPHLDLVRPVQLSPVLVVIRTEFYSEVKPPKNDGDVRYKPSLFHSSGLTNLFSRG